MTPTMQTLARAMFDWAWHGHDAAVNVNNMFLSATGTPLEGPKFSKKVSALIKDLAFKLFKLVVHITNKYVWQF